MKYFTKANSEAELEDQYRKLLVKYDFKSGKNQKIIEEIEKEYKVAVRNIPLEQRNVPNFVKAASRSLNAMEQKQQAEEARKKALEAKRYTKEDLNKLLNEKKRMLLNILVDVMSNNIAYRAIKTALTRNATDFQVYLTVLGIIGLTEPRWKRENNALVERSRVVIATPVLAEQWKKEFHALEEKIEYAVYSLSGKNEKNTEAVLQKIDLQMGAYIKEIFPKVEDKYCDPIWVRDSMKLNKPVMQKIEKIENKALSVYFKFFLALPVILGVFITFTMTKEILMEGEVFGALQALAICVVIILAYCVIVKLVSNSLKKNKNARSRVRFEERDRKKEQNRSIIVNLLRIIKNMI